MHRLMFPAIGLGWKEVRIVHGNPPHYLAFQLSVVSETASHFVCPLGQFALALLVEIRLLT